MLFVMCRDVDQRIRKNVYKNVLVDKVDGLKAGGIIRPPAFS